MHQITIRTALLFSWLILCLDAAIAQIPYKVAGNTLVLSFPDTVAMISEKPRIFKKNFRTPVVLIATGLYSMTDNDILCREDIKEARDEYLSGFRHHADDYLQYLPAVAVYGLNIAGIKGRNNFGNRTALLLKSELIMASLTFSLKKISHVPRPDTGRPTSFPSGHTAQAFAAATFMHKEYGQKSIWYSIGSYSVAAGIGVMRVLNDRHWISDVLAGAGIGILSTNLAYYTHRYKWKPRKHPMVFIPSYDNGPAMYFCYTF